MIAFTHSRRSTDRSFVRGSTILDGCKLPRAIGRCFGGLERREFDCRGDVVVARARGCSAASLVFLLPLDEKKSEGVIVLSAKTRANAIPRGMASLTFVITRVITRHTVITERHMLFWRTKNYVLFCRKHRVSLRQMALLRTLLRVDFCVVTNA